MIDVIPTEVHALASAAIPDLVKRMDFLLAMREYIKQLRSEGAYAELNEWLSITVSELRLAATQAQSEKRQARIHRIYGYVAPAAIPIFMGILTGTIKVG